MTHRQVFRLFLAHLAAFCFLLPSQGISEERTSLKRAGFPGAPAEIVATGALSHFDLINQPGFSDKYNHYAWSMAVFKEQLYVGTWNFYGLYRNPPANGAQVYRYVEGTEWERVVDAGLGNINNQGLRTMIVWDDPDDSPDKGPAIYGTTLNEADGLEVWRTFDGDLWEVVVGPGARFSNGFDGGYRNNAGRAMQVYRSGGKEWLYLGTRGYLGGEIWRTDDGIDWEKVTDARALGLGGTPLAMATMCVFQDDPQKSPALFVGTWGITGFNVIKSYDGLTFEVAASNGIRGGFNHGVAQLIVFENRLWLLSINLVEGFDIFTAGPDVIHGNQDWEWVAVNGLTDIGNKYAWNAIVYDNGKGPRLYIGTFNPIKGFYLYSVSGDMQWAIEVGSGSDYPSGLGQVSSYGARSFAIYNDRLVIGLACMPKPAQVWTAW